MSSNFTRDPVNVDFDDDEHHDCHAYIDDEEDLTCFWCVDLENIESYQGVSITFDPCEKCEATVSYSGTCVVVEVDDYPSWFDCDLGGVYPTGRWLVMTVDRARRFFTYEGSDNPKTGDTMSWIVVNTATFQKLAEINDPEVCKFSRIHSGCYNKH